jgi:DNA-binding transcriptional regulator YiaG
MGGNDRARRRSVSEVELVGVAAVGQGLLIEVEWADGVRGRVDLGPGIARVAAMAGLRDATTFARAAVSDDRWAVEWPGDVDVDSHSLFALAVGAGTLHLRPDALAAWRRARRLSAPAAARELGITPDQLERYEGGLEPAPQTVALAFRSLLAAIPLPDAA